MSWLQIHIFCQDNLAEQIGEELNTFGALAVTFLDAADQPVYEPKPGTTPLLWQETKVTGLFDLNQSMQEIIQHFEKREAEGNIKNFHIQSLADQDWVRLSLESFKPILIGKRLCICPSWTKPPSPHLINVMLDPGLAFGTGTHATTALCLEWLEQHITSPSLVIDYGCGSGILGIAALKLGAQKVIAIDYDPQALTATRANSELNHIPSSHLETYLPEEAPSPEADLIIANILAQPLIELAPLFYNLLKKDGKIIISGILEQQIRKIVEIYQVWFNIGNQVLKDGWACIEATKSK